MTKVLIAPDKFKGSLTAIEVCRAVQNGIQKYDANIECIFHPLADGGEGTLDTLENSLQLESRTLTVNDPLFRPITGDYRLNGHSAYIEMSTASGLELLSQLERNCMDTTSYGTGELISDAIKHGAKEIYLFIGGSATNDAGIGLLSALGYRFLNESGKGVQPIGSALKDIVSIDDSELKLNLDQINVTVVCDVTNPLYGPLGAAYIYGPQKGASLEEIEVLDLGLVNFNEIVKSKYGKDLSKLEGGGAAGGIGAGAVGLLNAQLQPGIQSVMDITGFKKHIEDIDLIVTGEGKLDSQTVRGKVVDGVYKSASLNRIPMTIICGVAEDLDIINEKINSPLYQIKTDDISFHDAMNNAKEHVERCAFQLIEEFLQKGLS